jgi:hypothetical protein
MLNKVLDTLASTFNDILARATVLLAFFLKGLFGTKLMFLILYNCERYSAFLIYSNSIPPAYQGAKVSCL